MQNRQQLCLSVWPRQGAYLGGALPAHIDQGAYEEVVKRRIGLVEAPPQPACEWFDFLRGNAIEPLPGDRTLPHATNGDKAEQARTKGGRVGTRHPIRQPIEFGLSSDEVVHGRERIRVGDIGRRWGWNRRAAVQLCGRAPPGLASLCCGKLFAELGQRFDDVTSEVFG